MGGTRDMYIYSDDKLECVSTSACRESETSGLKPAKIGFGSRRSVNCYARHFDALHVMSGDFTCCRLSHPQGGQCDREKLVKPMLFLYAEMLRQKNDEEFLQLHEATEQNRESIFPKEFIYSSGGYTQKKTLFGDLLDTLHRMLQRGELHLDRATVTSAPPPSKKNDLATLSSKMAHP